MEGGSEGEGHGLVALLEEGDVLAELGPVVGVGAIFDDDVGAFVGVLAAEVGDALFGDDDLNGVFAVVHVGHEGDDGGDLAALGGGGAGEDGEVGVAGEVAGTADAVHHLASHDVGRVHIAAEVDFDGGVHGDDAEAPDDFGVVGDLLRAHEDLRAEEVDVGGKAAHGLGGEGEGAGGGEGTAAVFEQGDDGVLKDFGVHFEGGDGGIRAKRAKDGIGDIADAGLEGEELGRDAAGLHFSDEEVGDVLTDLVSEGGGGIEAGGFVFEVGVDDAGDFLGVDDAEGGADAVVDLIDGDFLAGRGILGFPDVVHADEGGGVFAVDFDEDLVGEAEVGIGGPDGGGEEDATAGGDFGGFDDGPVDGAQEAVAGDLGQQGEVHVKELHLAGVDLGAEDGIGLVGGPEADGFGFG